MSAPFISNSGLHMPLANGNTSFYPTAGYVADSGSRTNDGKHMMEWTNFPAGAGGTNVWNWQYSSCLDLNMETGSNLTIHWNSTRSVGKSVRCMKMKRNMNPQSNTGNEGFGTPTNSTW